MSQRMASLTLSCLTNLTQHTSITSTNHKYFLGIGMRVKGKVGDHLLVTLNFSKFIISFGVLFYMKLSIGLVSNIRKLVPLGALNDVV